MKFGTAKCFGLRTDTIGNGSDLSTFLITLHITPYSEKLQFSKFLGRSG